MSALFLFQQGEEEGGGLSDCSHRLAQKMRPLDEQIDKVIRWPFLSTLDEPLSVRKFRTAQSFGRDVARAFLRAEAELEQTQGTLVFRSAQAEGRLYANLVKRSCCATVPQYPAPWTWEIGPCTQPLGQPCPSRSAEECADRYMSAALAAAVDAYGLVFFCRGYNYRGVDVGGSETQHIALTLLAIIQSALHSTDDQPEILKSLTTSPYRMACVDRALQQDLFAGCPAPWQTFWDNIQTRRPPVVPFRLLLEEGEDGVVRIGCRLGSYPSPEALVTSEDVVAFLGTRTAEALLRRSVKRLAGRAPLAEAHASDLLAAKIDAVRSGCGKRSEEHRLLARFFQQWQMDLGILRAATEKRD